MSEMFEAVAEELEELFPPKKGGLVDRHRTRKAMEAAAAQEAENAAEPIEQASYRAVKTAPESPEIFSVNIVPVPAGGVAQVLPNSPYRYRASLAVIPPVTPTSAPSTTTVGSQTSPAAGTTITSQGLAAGTYTVSWQVQLGGTLAAVDANNFILVLVGGPANQSLNTAAVGTYPQPSITVVVPAGGALLLIRSNALATVGAVYTAQLTTTQVFTPVASTVVLSKDSSAALGGAGYPQASNGSPLITFSRAQLWAFNGGSSPVSVAVIAEIYAPEK